MIVTMQHEFPFEIGAACLIDTDAMQYQGAAPVYRVDSHILVKKLDCHGKFCLFAEVDVVSTTHGYVKNLRVSAGSLRPVPAPENH